MRFFHLGVGVILVGAVACSSSQFGGLTGSKDKDEEKDESESLGTDGEDSTDIRDPEQVAGAFLAECSVTTTDKWTGDAAALDYATLYGCGIFNSAEDKTRVADLKVSKVRVEASETTQFTELVFKETEDLTLQLLIPVPNVVLAGGLLHIGYTLAGTTDEVVVSLGDEQPSGCALIAEESPKILPVVMDLETRTKRGLEEGGQEPFKLFKSRGAGFTAEDRIKLKHVEGEVLYDLHPTNGSVEKHAACPFRYKIAFYGVNAPGAVIPGKTLEDLLATEGGMAVPAQATTAYVGFEEPSLDDYDDNEGVERYADRTLEFSTGGCSFTFQLLRCTP